MVLYRQEERYKTMGKRIYATAEEARKAHVNSNYEYQKKAIKQVKFQLNKNTDPELIKHLESVGNIAGYLKRLIKADMEEGSEKFNVNKELKEWLRTEIMVAETDGSKEELMALKRVLRTLKAIEQGKAE